MTEPTSDPKRPTPRPNGGTPMPADEPKKVPSGGTPMPADEPAK